jgi:hypothetical protein
MANISNRPNLSVPHFVASGADSGETARVTADELLSPSFHMELRQRERDRLKSVIVLRLKLEIRCTDCELTAVRPSRVP